MKWYVLHTRSSLSERELREQMETCSAVKEAYYPLQERKFTTKRGDVRIHPVPLIPCLVFVRGELLPMREYISEYNIQCNFQLGSTRDFNNPMIIPDEKMSLFRLICDNYSRAVMFIQKPYSEFTNCDIVSFREGPLAGVKGKLKEIKRDRKVIFDVNGWTFAISNAQRYALTVECPANKDSEQRRLFQLIDACLVHLQEYGYIDNAAQQLRYILALLETNPNISEIISDPSCNESEHAIKLLKSAPLHHQSHFSTLSQYILIRKKEKNLDTQIPSCPLRPFLTIESGISENKEIGYVEHGFKSSISSGTVKEAVIRKEYDEPYPDSKDSSKISYQTNCYYAHVGIFEDKDNEEVLTVVNMDEFYSYYESLEDKDKFLEKLQKTGANLFYELLTDAHKDGYHFLKLDIEGRQYAFLGRSIPSKDYDESDLFKQIDVAYALCQEIIKNTHLMTWRRHLSTVWLRK